MGQCVACTYQFPLAGARSRGQDLVCPSVFSPEKCTVADSRQLQARLHLREGGGGFLCQFVSHPWSMGNGV